MEGSSTSEYEIGNILPEKNENSIDSDNRSLSPVLISSNLNRKHLFRKRNHRKSRTRLSDRFLSEGTSNLNNRVEDEAVNSKPQVFSEEDFTLSQTENILNCLDRLEEIQKNREQAYKLVIDSKNSDFFFKKPISPAPKKFRSQNTISESPSSSKYESSDIIEEEEYIKKLVPSVQEDNKFQTGGGFQTATGRTICISESEIEKHSNLFSDILTPSQNIDNSRKNKYNFLTKIVSSCTENANNTLSGSCRKSSIPNQSVSDCSKVISLTQEICESGISNTQMWLAAETILSGLESNKINTEFRGFNHEEICKSTQIADDFNKLNHQISNKRRNCHFDEDTGFHPKKKLKQKNIVQRTKGFSNGDQENLMLSGFLCASGKHIPRTFDDSENPVNKLANTTHLNKIGNSPMTIQCDENMSKPIGIKNKLKFFDDLIGDDCDMGFQSNSLGLSKASGGILQSKSLMGHSEKKSPMNGVKGKLAFFDKILDNTEFDCMPSSIKNKTGFCVVSRDIVLPNIQDDNSTPILKINTKNKIKMLDSIIGMSETRPPSAQNSVKAGFSTASGKSFQLSEKALNKASTLFDDLNSECDNTTKAQKQNSTSKNQSSYDTPKRTNPFDSSGVTRSKRKLGIASCKPIAISSDRLNMAKKIFEEEFGSVSPIRPIQSISNVSTPILKNHNATPRTVLPKESHDETPTISGLLEKDDKIEWNLAEESLVTFVDPDSKNDLDLVSELESECKRLEERLKILIKRQEALFTMENTKLENYRKPCPGILIVKKSNATHKIPIAAYVQDHFNDGVSDLFFITPQNAENIHFKESSSVIVTQDGATVIPNSKDLIGLKEIERSMRKMPHIEECLIPKGWIKNHYKWIIWKLASYERMFPTLFKGYLSVEHVIQQLKYRYDREIDKAERPAIRKICEKDDVPQKRLVLCVSDIKKTETGKFELELTDGWYSIRTVVDDPLCNQIKLKKIRIGTKIVTSGAELMCCDGSSPLELTNMSYLKINYNSTRRALWNTRLGYQRFPGPFPIQIHTVLPTGGPIGAIEICIARVYPIKYLEKTEGRAVWRNKKSEERKAQVWQIEQSRRLEQIEDIILKEFSNAKPNTDTKKVTRTQDISAISNPEQLMDLIENSNDPESIHEKLSTSQRTAILEYRQNSYAKKMGEMAAKAKESAEKLKMAKRDVVSVLQMLVVDLNGSPTTAFSFSVWRPTESHFDVLREGACITVHNVLPRMNGDLSTGSKTLFRPGQQKDQMSDIFKRKLINISDISDMKFSTNFGEFDTVGLVVHMKIEEKYQEIWLTDATGRLLLIDIREGPGTCLLLDKLKRGQPTTVCNLTYKESRQDFKRASANQFSIFSCYSQFGHLQKGLEKFQKELPKVCDELLRECDGKIGGYSMTPNKTIDNISHIKAEDCDEDELVPSRITSTDIALSLIDIDELS